MRKITAEKIVKDFEKQFEGIFTDLQISAAGIIIKQAGKNILELMNAYEILDNTTHIEYSWDE